MSAGRGRAAVGARGEEAAVRHLERAGLRVLDRNWRRGRYELDLVAREGDVVAFVEVKARHPGPQASLEGLGWAQRRRLRRAAEAWIHAHPGVGREFRFDLVGVTFRPGRAPRIEHVRAAFHGDDG